MDKQKQEMKEVVSRLLDDHKTEIEEDATPWEVAGSSVNANNIINMSNLDASENNTISLYKPKKSV